MNTKRKNSKGFTLVELIVVLVILAILIALLVPALTGYIDKANQKSAMTECRQVVVATQTTASELYGKDEFSLKKMNELQRDILKLAEIDGTIDNWCFTDPSTLDVLLYTSKKNITVQYKDKKYTILETNSFLGNVQGITTLANKLNNDHALSETDFPTRTQKLQQYLREENDNKLPELNENEKKVFSNYDFNSSIDTDKIVWKPFYDNNGEIFLAADNNGNDSKSSQAAAGLIYYKGDYYIHTNGYRYDTNTITDRGSYEVVISDEPKTVCWKKITLE